ncbi:MAG TPA: ABC transporter permease [Candidatus Saccharimonadales bacterium]|nr:ABC transporter permease [Candidatus Saccharimonadales bacterium]
MSPRRTFATTARVLRQLSHDHRTVGLLFVVPLVLMGLLAWLYSNTPGMFDMLGPTLLGLFPFIVMFVVTAMTTLRERSSGTLERLLAMPVGKLDIIVGYALSFGVLAIIQATLVSVVALHLYGLDIEGPQWGLILVALVNSLLGTTLGLLASAFARTEFQAAQFMPAFVLPQFLLCGLLVPLNQMPDILRHVADVLPLTYAVKAMNGVASEATLSSNTYTYIAIVLGFAVVAVLLGAATLRRQTR